jgi:hypothetical protein
MLVLYAHLYKQVLVTDNVPTVYSKLSCTKGTKQYIFE